MKAITENSRVSLSLVITLFAALSAAYWTYFQTSANAKAIEEVKQKQSAIEMIQTDIAVIKIKVENIEKSLPIRHR